MGLIQDEKRRFLYILADGKLHEEVAEGTEGAVFREYEKSDKTTGSKWEMTYSGIKGKIKEAKFYDSDYGTNLNVSIVDEDGEEFVLSLKANNGYGESMMEALPNIKLEEEVTIKPYINKKTNRRSLFIVQNDERVSSAFQSWNEDTKSWDILVKDFPQPNAKTIKKNTSELWKIFFALRNEWLKDYMVDNNYVEPADEVEEGSTTVPADKDDF